MLVFGLEAEDGLGLGQVDAMPLEPDRLRVKGGSASKEGLDFFA